MESPKRVSRQNTQWFARWIWGEEVELPLDVEGEVDHQAPGR